MAARRGKTQARRNPGSGGLPGWAWGVIGVLVGIVLILAVPRLLESDGEGFFRPQANPDARPVPVAEGDDPLVPEPRRSAGGAAGQRAGDGATRETGTGPEYDFYTLLPGKEVPVSDAELAATQRAEAGRLARLEAAQADAAGDNPDAADRALPQPVQSDPVAPDTAPPDPTPPRATADAATVERSGSATTAAGAGDGTRYLLQAGAFQASGQAEELKARIALLGLSARVEGAAIGGKTVYRVRMGPYGTASDLAEAKRKLASGGLPAMAIKVQ